MHLVRIDAGACAREDAIGHRFAAGLAAHPVSVVVEIEEDRQAALISLSLIHIFFFYAAKRFVSGRIIMNTKIRDLTSGHVTRTLLRFAGPMFLANLLQSFYSLVDMAVVGRFVGSGGLAAVSSASMLVFLITSACTGPVSYTHLVCSPVRAAFQMYS